MEGNNKMFTSNTSECDTVAGQKANILAALFFARILGEIKPEHAVEDVLMKTSDGPANDAIGRLTVNYAETKSATVRITFKDETFEIDGLKYEIDTPVPILQTLGMVVSAG